MGRHSGFIACYAALAHNDANFVLIPEVPFTLDGAGGFLDVLKKRVRASGHAVVVVAEGAGQDLMGGHTGATDASGNAKLGDIGVFLKQKITEAFAAAGLELNLKYFDPSYSIRSVRANPFDSVYCLRLAHNAVHAAMAGRTDVVVSAGGTGGSCCCPSRWPSATGTRSIRTATCGCRCWNRPASRPVSGEAAARCSLTPLCGGGRPKAGWGLNLPG